MEVIQSGRRLLGTYFRVAFYGQVRSSWLLYLQFSCREDTFTCTARCCTQNGLWKLECKSNGCGESDSLTTRRLCDSSMITWINLNCAATWYNTTIFNKGMVATLLRFIAHVCPQMTVSTSLNDHRSHSVKHHLYLTPLYWSVCHDCGKRVFTYWIAVCLLRAMQWWSRNNDFYILLSGDLNLEMWPQLWRLCWNHIWIINKQTLQWEI